MLHSLPGPLQPDRDRARIFAGFGIGLLGFASRRAGLEPVQVDPRCQVYSCISHRSCLLESEYTFSFRFLYKSRPFWIGFCAGCSSSPHYTHHMPLITLANPGKAVLSSKFPGLWDCLGSGWASPTSSQNSTCGKISYWRT